MALAEARLEWRSQGLEKWVWERLAKGIKIELFKGKNVLKTCFTAR